MTQEPPELTTEERELRARLLASAERLDEPPHDLDARILARVRPTRWSRWVALAAIVLGAGGTMVVVSLTRPPLEPATATVAPEPVEEPEFDPCSRPVKASGSSPLIDDFEDGNPNALAVERRGGAWMLHFDSDEEGGVPRTPWPVRLEDASDENHYALHLMSPELRDWGANTHLVLAPFGCYDASAYVGLSIRARGKGRMYLGATTVAETLRRWGGTCDEDCYNIHAKAIDLSDEWQTYSFTWNEFRQRGYDAVPLNPATLYDVVIRVQAEDTPMDIWIDDVRFLPRE